MGKGKRIKQSKRLLLNQEQLVRMALDKGKEQGFMLGMEHMQKKLETVSTVKGVGKELHKRLIQHFYSLNEMEHEKL